jgi:hypothetical protein
MTSQGWPCSLWIDGTKVGALKTDTPTTVDVPAGKEGLVECFNKDSTPVPLYARYHIGSFGPRSNLPAKIEIAPVAVLVNLVKAAYRGTVTAKETDDHHQSETCENSDHNYAIPKGSEVRVISEQVRHCKETNFIQVQFDGKQQWRNNWDFSRLGCCDRSVCKVPPAVSRKREMPHPRLRRFVRRRQDTARIVFVKRRVALPLQPEGSSVND